MRTCDRPHPLGLGRCDRAHGHFGQCMARVFGNMMHWPGPDANIEGDKVSISSKSGWVVFGAEKPCYVGPEKAATEGHAADWVRRNEEMISTPLYVVKAMGVDFYGDPDDDVRPEEDRKAAGSKPQVRR